MMISNTLTYAYIFPNAYKNICIYAYMISMLYKVILCGRDENGGEGLGYGLYKKKIFAGIL